MKLNAEELRDVDETAIQEQLKTIKRQPLYLILEGVYDTYNIGGLFRLADALAVEKMYLCGEMETPPNHRILKASIGTYKVVPWEYKKTVKEAIMSLRGAPSMSGREAIKIVAVEQSKQAIDYREADYSLPLAIIVGNETSGVTQETMDLADQIVEIPMWGINKSLNVIVSAAIVSYWAMGKKV